MESRQREELDSHLDKVDRMEEEYHREVDGDTDVPPHMKPCLHQIVRSKIRRNRQVLIPVLQRVDLDRLLDDLDWHRQQANSPKAASKFKKFERQLYQLAYDGQLTPFHLIVVSGSRPEDLQIECLAEKPWPTESIAGPDEQVASTGDDGIFRRTEVQGAELADELQCMMHPDIRYSLDVAIRKLEKMTLPEAQQVLASLKHLDLVYGYGGKVEWTTEGVRELAWETWTLSQAYLRLRLQHARIAAAAATGRKMRAPLAQSRQECNTARQERPSKDVAEIRRLAATGKYNLRSDAIRHVAREYAEKGSGVEASQATRKTLEELHFARICKACGRADPPLTGELFKALKKGRTAG